jgi:hypothetical protein
MNIEVGLGIKTTGIKKLKKNIERLIQVPVLGTVGILFFL